MQTYILSFGKYYFSSYTGLSKSAWRGIILSFIVSTLMGVYYFLSIYFVNVLHLSISNSGLILSCYGVGAILGAIISGKLADKFSPSIVLTLSLIIQGLGYITLGGLQKTELLMCDVFLIGLSNYGFITANYLWVLSLCKSNEAQRLKAINLLSTASNLGLGLSALIISQTVQFGFKYMFLVSGIIILCLSCFLLLQEDKQNHPARKPISKTSHTLAKNKIITWLVLLSVLFIGSIVTQIGSTYNIYITHTFPQLGIKAISILFALNSFMVVLIEAPLGNFLRLSNKIFMIGVGGFLIGFGMFILNFSYIFAFAILSCIIYTTGEIIFFCMTQFVCYQRGANGNKGHSLGMYRMTYATSRVIGTSIGGYLYANLGSHMIWHISGLIGLACFIACNNYKKYE